MYRKNRSAACMSFQRTSADFIPSYPDIFYLSPTQDDESMRCPTATVLQILVLVIWTTGALLLQVALLLSTDLTALSKPTCRQDPLALGAVHGYQAAFTL